MKAVMAALLILVALAVFPPETGYAESIRLDGDFTDWVDKPAYASEENEGDRVDGFRQMKWYLSREDDRLYIMTTLKNPQNGVKGSIITEMETDFGTFQAVTDYAAEEVSTVAASVYAPGSGTVAGNRVSVLTTVGSGAQDWKEGGYWGSVLPDGSIHIEYAVPVNQMTGGMEWGYMIKFRLLNSTEGIPESSWITVSSASTFPFVGVGLCVVVGVALPTFIKRKKKE